jgi:large subunit ribosomal protein L35
MPKQKTHRGAAKRFRVSATGKVKRGKAYKSHLLTSKDAKRRRHLDKDEILPECEAKVVRKMLPYGRP